MESEYDVTQGSTLASSVPSTPISPDTYLLEVLQHITANQSMARKPAPQNGSNGSISMLSGIDLSQYKSAFTRLQQVVSMYSALIPVCLSVCLSVCVCLSVSVLSRCWGWF